MKLIEIYIQEVTRRLPEKNRTDIALELRSTIEDMLPENYGEEDVKGVLNQLGSPVVLANGYKDQPMHLIGPRYFDVYVTLLKMILPIAALIAFITIITQYFNGYNGDDTIINAIIDLISKGIKVIMEVGIQTFFWLTVTFAVIERFDKENDPEPLTASLEKWTADDLKNIAYIPKRKAISKVEVFGSLMWTALWATLYFKANQLVGVYEGNSGHLDFVMPAFNQEVLLQYWPIILIIIGFEIALTLYKFLKQQWTKGMAICNTFLQLIITIIFIIMLTNPNLLNETFIVYMTDLFNMTKDQLNILLIGGGVSIFIIGAAVNVYDGLKRVRVR